ncbi:MAG: hypothetical protein JWO38_4970 [Gemmataceae bacterium]|nr:hypothetical protein [Gemmataceae bacterium]
MIPASLARICSPKGVPLAVSDQHPTDIGRRASPAAEPTVHCHGLLTVAAGAEVFEVVAVQQLAAGRQGVFVVHLFGRYELATFEAVGKPRIIRKLLETNDLPQTPIPALRRTRAGIWGVRLTDPDAWPCGGSLRHSTS